MRAAVEAFLRRDAGVAWSYRLPFVLDAVAAAFTVVMFFMISRLVPAGRVSGGYFAFAVAGLAVAALLQAAVTVLAGNLRQEQVQGTLEVTLASGVRPLALAVGMSVYPVLAGVLRGLVFVALAAALGARAAGADWGLALGAAALGSVSFAAIGVAAGALVLVIRQAAAATAWIVTVLALGAGAVFPQRLLPEWARTLADLSPLTHALEVIRGALLEGRAWGQAWGSLGALAGLGVVYGAVALAVLALALRHARRAGTLGQY